MEESRWRVILLFAAAIIGVGYFTVGPGVLLFSLTFVGGLVVWLLAAFQADIDPHTILLPYLVTVILFIAHVSEEHTAHIEVPLSEMMHILLTQRQFLTVAAFGAPIIWLAAPC